MDDTLSLLVVIMQISFAVHQQSELIWVLHVTDGTALGYLYLDRVAIEYRGVDMPPSLLPGLKSCLPGPRIGLVRDIRKRPR